jgi:hypothetical protein
MPSGITTYNQYESGRRHSCFSSWIAIPEDRSNTLLRNVCDHVVCSLGVSLLLTCTRHGHQHRVTVTRGCIDTICLS